MQSIEIKAYMCDHKENFLPHNNDTTLARYNYAFKGQI